MHSKPALACFLLDSCHVLFWIWLVVLCDCLVLKVGVLSERKRPQESVYRPVLGRWKKIPRRPRDFGSSNRWNRSFGVEGCLPCQGALAECEHRCVWHKQSVAWAKGGTCLLRLWGRHRRNGCCLCVCTNVCKRRRIQDRISCCRPFTVLFYYEEEPSKSKWRRREDNR